ncbi:MAG: S1 RNA-binding domain-containing protein, partial [Methanosarcinales archaeon]|nr:S1 RNA-binding domain-containing protein [Methanosarcinales archaeon]
MGSCIKCGGTGKLVTGENSCSACKGAGKAKTIDFNKISEKDIASVMANGMPCPECSGKGVIEFTETCSECDGSGDDGVVNMQPCSVCNTPTDADDGVCEDCKKLPLVYELDSTCDVNEVVEGNVYKGTVGDIVTFGAFVSLCKNLRGLVHESNMKWELHSKDPIFVKVKMIKPNGNLELAPVRIYEHNTVRVEKTLPRTPLGELEEHVSRLVHIAGEVVQVKQTSGPTIFTISDESGLVFCAAFETAGERAYPDIVNEDIVKVIGDVALRQNELQIEVKAMNKLTGASAIDLKKLIDEAIDERATPDKIDFLVKSEVMEKLRP